MPDNPIGLRKSYEENFVGIAADIISDFKRTPLSEPDVYSKI